MGVGLERGRVSRMEVRIDEVIKEACEIQGAGIAEGMEDVDILIIEFRSIG